MLDFLAQNYGSIIAGAAVAVVLLLAVVKVIRDKRTPIACHAAEKSTNNNFCFYVMLTSLNRC